MKKYVDTGAMQVVVVAPAAASKDKLGALGEVKVQPMPSAGSAGEMLKGSAK
jgi:hypothetical protein